MVDRFLQAIVPRRHSTKFGDQGGNTILKISENSSCNCDMIFDYVNEVSFDSILYPAKKKTAIKIIEGQCDLDKYIEYINHHKIEEAIIEWPNLDFLRYCPSLIHFKIGRPLLSSPSAFDFTPLYEKEIVKSLIVSNLFGPKLDKFVEIDFSKLRGLESLFTYYNRGTLNISSVQTLKSLRITGYKAANRNITDLFTSSMLDTLVMCQGNIKTLEGIDRAPLIYLSLNYMKSLENIDSLINVKDTLRSLNISCCSKIQDFSILQYLINLEKLEIEGCTCLPNLDFVKKLPHLKTLILANTPILDGNIELCKQLQYVKIYPYKKPYNVLKNNLPKNTVVRGNELIEEWRRFE